MYNAKVITVSDKGSKGLREDESGPAIKKMLVDAGYIVIDTIVIPDEMELIKKTLIDFSDEETALVVTTGGTGFAPRDVTPEATLCVCEKNVPGIPELMRSESLKITKNAILSRAVAGIRGKTLIINLPGSPKGATQNLSFVLESIKHGIDILRGISSECARKDEKNSRIVLENI